MLIDTHAHLNFQAFTADFPEVLKRAKEEGVEKIINVGASLDSSQKAVEISQKYEGLYASVGIHPHHAEETLKNFGTKELKNKLDKLAQNPKVVAIGEGGLDYHMYKNGGIANPEKQKKLFLVHLDLAQKLNLPLIFHCRDAHDDMLKTLKLYTIHSTPYAIQGVFHCFSGDQDFLESVLEMGFYVGFDGNITYKSAQCLRDLVSSTPIDRLLLETDCPYLPPEPFRGLRNEPKNVKIVAGAVAEIKGLPSKVVAEKTSENAHRLFKI
ncbi:TatD family hydrolase [Candidatus Microgenomates bacterium]|nr:TatD family hydrolase [Candidatus Microgenomates bacterium]